MPGILGRKLGMTRLFESDGRVVPVTVIEAGPCSVVLVRENAAGEKAAQLGFGEKKPKRVKKPAAGHARRAGLETVPAVLRTVGLGAGANASPGDVVKVDIFTPGDRVKVTGISKGRGFQGVVKRHGFRGGPASHGNTRYRKPGSVGPGTNPSRVIKGKRSPGHMGAARRTQIGLCVVKVDADQNLLFVRGAIPGPKNGVVMVRKQEGKGRYA